MRITVDLFELIGWICLAAFLIFIDRKSDKR